MSVESVENHKQNIGFTIELSNVDWSVSPARVKAELEKVISEGNLHFACEWNISLLHVRLEP